MNTLSSSTVTEDSVANRVENSQTDQESLIDNSLMQSSSEDVGGQPEAASGKTLAKSGYNRLWRWHLLAGLYVIPFMLMLSLTGIIMMLYKPVLEPLLYPELLNIGKTAEGTALSWQQQVDLVKAAYPDGVVRQLLIPAHEADPVRFFVKEQGMNLQVFVDPYQGSILGAVNKDATLYALADDIHGTLLLGAFGDGLIELSAALTLILLATGLMMWWSR